MARVTLGELGLGADDLAAIGKLSEKGMTPEQIADAVEQAHLSKDAIGKIEGLNSSASEIDGVIQRSKNTLILLGDSITAGNTSNSPDIVTITTNVGQAV